jgi:hypothetical protein
MSAAFVPAQLLAEGDQLHPRNWFQMEVLNIYLNIAAQQEHAHERHRRGGPQHDERGGSGGVHEVNGRA